MPRLAPIRTFLNPQFESYKLSFSPSPILKQVSLPQSINQARSGLGAIGFQKVASRVRHNHLAVGNDIGVYVAENGTVYSINVDDVDAASPIREIFQLPEFISDPKRTQGEYPGAVYVLSDIWLLSDGHGGAYLVRVPPQNEYGSGSSAQFATYFEFISDNDDTLPTPFQLHNVSVVDPGNAIAIVSTSVPHAQPKDQHLFDIWGLKFSFPDVQQSMDLDLSPDKPSRLIPLFRKRGTHIPFHTSYFPSIRSFLFLSGSTYTSIDAPPSTQEYTPTPDEYAPIPQLGDDIAEGSFDLNTSSSATSIPPPYSWTQTEDSVTVAFALPGTTPKKSIRVLFGKNTISLSAGDPLLAQPFYNNAPLWDSIDASSSLWTWERPPAVNSNPNTNGAVVVEPAPAKAGLLTLHLEKVNQKTRWSSLFAQGFEVAEVPETLDPSELAHIRDMLDKYTSTIKDGGGGRDFGHGVPSIAQGERDVDVDEAVGRRALCIWVNLDEITPEWPIDDTPATILSLPMPTSTSVNPPFTLVAKHDIDGPLFALEFPTGPDILSPSWTHIQTYSALSFVLASKQDTRFTYHYQRNSSSSPPSSPPSPPSSDGVVLAFESGSRSSGSANVYAYHSSKRGDKQARQSVFQMRPGSGALVGVGVVHSTKQGGEPVLICLCEKEVTLCRNVF